MTAAAGKYQIRDFQSFENHIRSFCVVKVSFDN